MFRTTTQLGRLYSSTANNNFQIDATNGNLVFRTNDVRRALIMQGTTGVTINGYSGLIQTGFMGVGLFTGSGGPSSPFTYLHIDDGGTTADNYRPWMKQGTLITHEDDQGYFGLKDEGSDHNPTVVSWSDNDAWTGSPDALKFIFSANNTGALGTAGDDDGLEAGRFTPDASGDEVYFGLGDWFNSGGDEPEERLDLLDGNLRIRDLPGTSPTSDDQVVVVDANGVVHWRPAEEIGNADCEWDFDDVAGSLNTCYNASPSSGCPGATDRVQIGAGGAASYKLTVIEDTPTSSRDVGIFVQTLGDDEVDNIGLWANCGVTGYDAAPYNAGIIAGATDGTTMNTGLLGLATTTSGMTTTENRGVVASAVAVGTVTTNYGLYASAAGATNDWAGWFEDGDVNVEGLLYTSDGLVHMSDGAFKENITPLASGLSTVAQLEPVSYNFNTGTYGYMSLPEGAQAGLIAEQVELVVPQVVHHAVFPAKYDEVGNQLSPETPFAGVDYSMLIPYLIAAVKEQQVQIEQLQSDLSGCCSGIGQGGEQHMAPIGGTDANSIAITSGNDALKIQPNPFSDATTISYTLAEGGSVRLLVSTSSGKQLQVLEDVQRSAGNYTYEWNTTSLASGIYNVMLLLDGAPMMQKAVKIAR